MELLQKVRSRRKKMTPERLDTDEGPMSKANTWGSQTQNEAKNALPDYFTHQRTIYKRFKYSKYILSWHIHKRKSMKKTRPR